MGFLTTGGNGAAEKTYTKADVMAKLSMCEASVDKRIDDDLMCTLFNSGARTMATALLDDMDAESVCKVKVDSIIGIMIDNLIELAQKGMRKDQGGEL